MPRSVLAASISVIALTLVIGVVFLVPPSSGAEPGQQPPLGELPRPRENDPWATYTDPVYTTPAFSATTPTQIDVIPGFPSSDSTNFGVLPTPALDNTSAQSTALTHNDPAPTTAETPESAPAGKKHVVARGDLMSDLSRTYYGTSRKWHLIRDANPDVDPNHLKPGTVLDIPALVKSSPAVSPTGTNGAADDTTYTVQKGDSYHVIAKKILGSAGRWKELEQLNNIPPGELRPGQVIRIPSKNTDNATVAQPGAVAPAGANGERTHVVAKGEYLSDVSKIYYGTTQRWKVIADANPQANPNNLKIGQTLVIPAIPDLATGPGATPTDGAAVSEPGVYVVAPGDIGGTIAAKTLGSARRWPEIAALNPKVDVNNLQVGDKLKLPANAKAETTGNAQTSGKAGNNKGAASPSPTPARPYDPELDFVDPFLALDAGAAPVR